MKKNKVVDFVAETLRLTVMGFLWIYFGMILYHVLTGGYLASVRATSLITDDVLVSMLTDFYVATTVFAISFVVSFVHMLCDTAVGFGLSKLKSKRATEETEEVAVPENG